MKKCLLFISLTVLFFSCSKDESLVSVVNEEVITTSENKTPLFQSEATSSGEEIKAKIQRFRERLQAIKDKEINFREADLTTDEAKWNIEATLNATYCKADTPFSTYDKSESQFTVPLQNGVINNEDLLAAYETAQGDMAAHYNSISSDYKHPIVMDIALESTTSTEATFQLISFIATAPSGNPPSTNCDVFGQRTFGIGDMVLENVVDL